MTLKTKISACILIVISLNSYGQDTYRREVKGITERWHKIILPEDIYAKTAADLADIRIIGLTAKQDTIEAPFILQENKDQVSKKEISFKIINVSKTDDGHYITFEVPTAEAINHIELQFKQNNFDWRLDLEGSHDQSEWFSILNDYRVLGFSNELDYFQFTTLKFPASKYHFFRVFVFDTEEVDLLGATLQKLETTLGKFRTFPIASVQTDHYKQKGSTKIDVELESSLPISRLFIDVQDDFSYYRPITINQVIDSVKTEQGWEYHYTTLFSGVLNSFEENVFNFKSVSMKQLRIQIDNGDNEPLNIGTIQVSGYEHEIVARFAEPATYYLTYGDGNVLRPSYDIERFLEDIPKTPPLLELGREKVIRAEGKPGISPLFKNKLWLWLTIVLVVLLLGWFSFNMISKTSDQHPRD